jgi:hypothetical protein
MGLTPLMLVDVNMYLIDTTLSNISLNSYLNVNNKVLTQLWSISITEFQIDPSFPDLYLISPEQGLDFYADYMDKKALRMGLTEGDVFGLLDFNFDYLNEPEIPVDPLNILEHKGKLINVSELTDKDKIQLLCELPFDKVQKYTNLECIKSQQHASTPSRKLHYPEPFIASASFVHTDIAFIHILHYNYWLWFVFVFLIVFFFLTFLCTVRWCNMRTRPRRETRGVSRSKCGDLITACVPVSWAASIIISESTDSSDLYDGFGAAEITVGIRAYQWGWEYYYPKAIDLNYNVKPSYSSFIGNSLKYVNSEEKTLSNGNLWRFYQNKETDSILTPAHLLILPLDHKKVLNFLNFQDIGSNNLNESSSFKKILTASKTFNSNLVSPITPFSSKYKKINQLQSSENLFNLSNNYGLTRQHNFLSLKSTTSQYSTFLDNKSFSKFLTHNTLKNKSTTTNLNFYNNLVDIQKGVITRPLSTFLSIDTLNLENSNNLTPSLDTLKNYPNLLTTINDNSDKKFFKYPLRKLFNNSLFSNSLTNSQLNNNSSSFITQNSSLTSSVIDNTLLNVGTTKKFSLTNSSNQSFLPSDQNLRQYKDLTPNTQNFNLNTSGNWFTSTSNWDLSKSYNNSRSGWINSELFSKIASNRTFIEAPYSPKFSSNLLVSALDYDKAGTSSYNVESTNNVLLNKNTVTKSNDIHILRGKRDGAPSFLNSTYWKMFWLNSSPTLRFDSVLKSNLLTKLEYIPSFTDYYDYDFRNVQAYEMLEDLFWETTHASYSHTDYLNTASNVNSSQKVNPRVKMREPFFFNDNMELPLELKPLTQSALKDISLTGEYYANSISFDDLVQPSALILKENFSLIPLSTNLFSSDESYEGWNDLRNLFSQNLTSTFNVGLSFYKSQSYLNVFNAFRADFEDFSWTNSTLNKSLTSESTTILNDDLSLTSLKELPFSADFNESSSRVSNPLTLRSTARNSIVTFNALQKVFRSRFEDGRSNASLQQFSELKTHQPFLTPDRVGYEKMLGKTRTSFYDSTFYTSTTLNILNDFSSLFSSLNFNFFDFPFLLAGKSDMSRYMWFDWYAKWGSQDVQLSSVSRYSSLGVPYISKPFDFNVENGESITDVEKYFTRLSRTRKNYIPNWTYTPYMYARSSSWSNSNLTHVLKVSDNNYTYLRILLKNIKWYNSSLMFFDALSSNFFPSNSGNSTYGKSLWRPFASTQAYYYTLSTLVDFLSKREALYRHYLELNNNVIHLPNELTANPNNPLLLDVKASFLFNDPTSFSVEYSREVYYNSLNFFKFLLVKDWLVYFKDTPVNLTFLNDYFFFYLFGLKNSYKNGNVVELYKNPYRPMKKGISSMLRLHATGAIGMPIEVRLQVLASSKDVIHSWSVPSAGVKIDCVPGYTTHKIMIFLMEGIYWGQCMEICGRFHHWMPIVVYFMRRDLFFLWCTHFIFNSSSDKSWDINDRQYTDYIKYVSYDKVSWLTELSNN